MAIKLRSRPKSGFGPPIIGIFKILEMRFQIALTCEVPSMWPVLVEFRSASSESGVSRRKEEDRKKKESQ